MELIYGLVFYICSFSALQINPIYLLVPLPPAWSPISTELLFFEAF